MQMGLNGNLMFGLGGMGISAFTMFTLLSEWPEGDPDKARKAAELWGLIADTADKGLDELKPLVTQVLNHNSGHGIDAFNQFWTGKLSPYPPQLSAYARRIAKAYDDYADALEHMQLAIIVMATESWLEFLLFCAWPEVGTQIEWLVRRMMRKEEVTLMFKLLASVVGSVFYAIVDVGLRDLGKLITGDEITLKDTSMSLLKDFVACVIFYQADPYLGPLNRLWPQNPMFKHYFQFWVGSNAFTISGNALNNPSAIINDSMSLMPTWKQEITKLIVPTGQLGVGRAGYPAPAAPAGSAARP
jgi:hypothetical protein